MQSSSLAFLYLILGVFFLFVGVSMLGISSTVESNSAYVAINPSTVLVIGGIADILMSLFLLGLTLRSFRTALFGGQPKIGEVNEQPEPKT
jgi:hypothetical protein